MCESNQATNLPTSNFAISMLTTKNRPALETTSSGQIASRLELAKLLGDICQSFDKSMILRWQADKPETIKLALVSKSASRACRIYHSDH